MNIVWSTLLGSRVTVVRVALLRQVLDDQAVSFPWQPSAAVRSKRFEGPVNSAGPRLRGVHRAEAKMGRV